jgi:hypothetical protein
MQVALLGDGMLCGNRGALDAPLSLRIIGDERHCVRAFCQLPLLGVGVFEMAEWPAPGPALTRMEAGDLPSGCGRKGTRGMEGSMRD